MAYTSLTSFMSGLASYGKNFQQYLDGVPSLSSRQAVATDLAQLTAEVAGYSGNTFANLNSLATALSSSSDVQNELSHTVQATRNSARTEWTQMIADFNALEVEEGYAAGDYGATSTLINAVLAAWMPNDLGQWSDKLTESQMSNAATALSALATRANLMVNALSVFGAAPEYWWDVRHGIVYEGTGTGTGSDIEVMSWTDRVAGVSVESTGGDAPVMTEWVNSQNALLFSNINQIMSRSGSVMAGSTGYIMAAFERDVSVTKSTICILFSCSSTASTTNAIYVPTTGDPERITVYAKNVNDAAPTDNAMSGTIALANRWNPNVIGIGTDGSSYHIRSMGADLSVVATAGVNNGGWLDGMPVQPDITCIGGMKRSSGWLLPWFGYLAQIAVWNRMPTLAEKQAVENSWMSIYGLD